MTLNFCLLLYDCFLYIKLHSLLLCLLNFRQIAMLFVEMSMVLIPDALWPRWMRRRLLLNWLRHYWSTLKRFKSAGQYLSSFQDGTSSIPCRNTLKWTLTSVSTYKLVNVFSIMQMCIFFTWPLCWEVHVIQTDMTVRSSIWAPFVVSASVVIVRACFCCCCLFVWFQY